MKENHKTTRGNTVEPEVKSKLHRLHIKKVKGTGGYADYRVANQLCADGVTVHTARRKQENHVRLAIADELRACPHCSPLLSTSPAVAAFAAQAAS